MDHPSPASFPDPMQRIGTPVTPPHGTRPNPAYQDSAHAVRQGVRRRGEAGDGAGASLPDGAERRGLDRPRGPRVDHGARGLEPAAGPGRRVDFAGTRGQAQNPRRPTCPSPSPWSLAEPSRPPSSRPRSPPGSSRPPPPQPRRQVPLPRTQPRRRPPPGTQPRQQVPPRPQPRRRPPARTGPGREAPRRSPARGAAASRARPGRPGRASELKARGCRWHITAHRGSVIAHRP